MFVQASEITALVPSLAGVTLVWVTAGLLTMGGALVCAELSSAFPRTGGVYVFLREIYSPALGFLWGWAMFWSMHTGIAAAIATVFARYAGYFVPMGDAALRGVAVGAIVVLSAVNYLGVRFGSGVQTAFTVVKVLAVAAIILVGCDSRSGDGRRGGGGCRGRRSAPAIFCSRSAPGSSPSAAGTWSPTPPRRRRIRSARFRGRWSSAR